MYTKVLEGKHTCEAGQWIDMLATSTRQLLSLIDINASLFCLPCASVAHQAT